MNAFVKQFPSVNDALEERLGHVFFSAYCTRAPKLIPQTAESSQLAYENLTGSTEAVMDVINRGDYVELEGLFEELADLTNTHAHVQISEGGTQKFFIQRIGRLDETLTQLYEKWCKNHPQMSVQGVRVTPSQDLVKDVSEAVLNFSHGMCAPSQGDIHERNIFSNGTIVDFEAAGWNLIATDIATFLWHTLFAGNYFGPLYGKWATDADHQWLQTQIPAFSVSGRELTLHLTPQRAHLAQQYLKTFVAKLASFDERMRKETAAAICFRLLTTFPIQLMSAEDRHIAFSFANYFYQEAFPESIERLLHA